jgi:hypothetical protein
MSDFTMRSVRPLSMRDAMPEARMPLGPARVT